jgi:methylmalonyl-CoA mutase N-terminal domain/subunit
LQIDETSHEAQIAKLRALKARRSQERVTGALNALKHAAEDTENTMPYILDAVRCYATTGEICDALRDVFGTYTETSVV